MKKILPVIILAFLLLSGCYGMSEQEKWEAQFYATQYAKDPANIPPPKYQTMAATALNYYFPIATATPSPNMNWTPTMNNWEYGQTQAAQVQYNQMTSQAQQQAFEMQKQRAEQAAQDAKETAIAHAGEMTAFAQATNVQGTAVAQATNIQGTAFAQSTSVAGTQAYYDKVTATSFAITQVYQPTADILTLSAVRIQQTVQAGEAEKVELAVKREQANNYFKAFWPYIVIGALTYVFGRGFSTWVKTRTHPRDEHGRPQTITRELDDGGVVIVKPEQLETGAMKITGDGSVIRYAPMDKQEQSDINRRAQAVEAIAALPTPYAQKGPQLLSGEFGGRSAPRVNFVNGNAMNPVLDEADNQFLEGSDEQ